VDWILIETDQDLHALLQRADACEAVMVDTEFMRRNTFYPQVALVQLCFATGPAAGTAWLIDPLGLTDPSPLAQLLTDSAVIKVLHSASEDLEVFQRWLGVLPQPLFDTQKAAALVGLEFGLGYRALVQQLCHEDLPKGETRSDWLQRPLTESQCHYAAQDVIWLLDVYTQLARRCREQGRWNWVLEDGAAACDGLASSNAADYYRRIKGAWKLPPGQLAVLIALCEWREKVAREKDKPRSWIIDDKTCLQLAQTQPATPEQLRDCADWHPSSLRRYGDALLQVIAETDQGDKANLPVRLPAPLTAAQRDQVKQLKTRSAVIAKELGVAPQMLVSGKDFEVLVRGDQPEPLLWSGWRGERVVAPLKDMLERSA